jgi:oligopeptide/dipeptide ABC transporter ATP-binding protein
MSAVPVPDPDIVETRQRVILEGDLPSPSNPPVGCNFNTRCPIAKDICFQDDPEYVELKPGHWVACHFAGQYL